MTSQKRVQFIRLLLFLVLLLLFSIQPGLVPSLAQQSEPPPQAQVPDVVRQRVQDDGQAPVIVTLQEPGRSAGHRMRKDEIAALQQNVLDNVKGSGFSARLRYAGIPAFAGTVNAQMLQALEHNPNVAFIMPDLAMQTDGNGREGIGVLGAHANGFTGQGVTVAVIDTGLKTSHYAYSGISDAITGEACFSHESCYPFGDDTGDSAEDRSAFGHGTVVGDIIAGPGGYAPDSSIVAVRVLDDDGGGYLSDWLGGLDWVWDYHVDYSIDVVNMSIGTFATFMLDPVPAGRLHSVGCDNDNPLFQEVAAVLQDLKSAYIPVFVSSGNLGSRGVLSAPACFSDVISVAATYSEDYGRFPPSGSYASVSPGFPDCHDQITAIDRIACFSNLPADIAAPGVHTVVNGLGQEGAIFGTSFASPAAAGIAALIKQEPPIPGLNLPSSTAGLLAAMQNSGTATYINEDPTNADPSLNPPLLDARALTGVVDAASNQICDFNVPDGDVYGSSGLVNAINQANALSLELAQKVLICLAPGSTYELVTSVGGSGSGLPVIYGQVSILGRGSTIRRADNAPDFRLFTVEDTANVPALPTILDLANVILENGNVTGEGGAIYVPADANNDQVSVRLLGVTLRDNEADTGGGAILMRGMSSELQSIQSAFENNSSRWGGAIYLDNATLTVRGTLFHQNAGVTAGGAIHFGGGIGAIDGSVFTNNISEAGGAIEMVQPSGGPAEGLFISATRFEANLARGGGAIHNNDNNTTLLIDTSQFIRNVALNFGGAIYFGGSPAFMEVTKSKFIENSVSDGAPGGGAIYMLNSQVFVIEAEFVGNVAVNPAGGAAFFNSGGALTVSQATFEDNVSFSSSPSGGGDVYADDPGSVNAGTFDLLHATIRGIRRAARPNHTVMTVTNSTVSITSSTIVNEHAIMADGSGYIAIMNTLMADVGCLLPGTGVIEPIGINIEAFSADVQPAAQNCEPLIGGMEPYVWLPGDPLDPLKLGDLADNGGFTRTISIGQDSRAANRIAPVDCTDFSGQPLLADQRGELRNDGLCDVGAYEYVLPKPADSFQRDVVLRGVDEYGFVDDVDGTDDVGEPTGCTNNPGDNNESQHMSVSGQSIFRGLAGGHSIFRGLASGSMFLELDTSGSQYDTAVGVYVGDSPTNLTEVTCENSAEGDAYLVLEIPGDQAESETPYRLIIWDEKNPNRVGEQLNLKINDITFRGCGEIQGIPALECEALLQFFENTGGDNWLNHNYWLDTFSPCPTGNRPGWYGVTCANGHVSGLSLIDNNVDETLMPTAGDYFGYFQSLIQTPTGQGIVVTTTSMSVADDGLCSLPEAILNANADVQLYTSSGECVAGSGDDIITLAKDKVYRLAMPNDPVNEIGLPDITSNITFEGNGARIERSLSPGTPPMRLMNITGSGVIVTINDVTFRNGLSTTSGGAIQFWQGAQSLIINNSRFINNQASVAGGAVWVIGGNLEVNDSLFYGSLSQSDGGAIYTELATGVVVRRSAFVNNQGNGSGGAIYFNTVASAMVVNSTFSGNSAGFVGAAIGSVDSADLTFAFLTMSENVARPGWGVMEIHGLTAPTTVGVKGLLMANNLGINCGKLVDVTVTSGGYNISDEGSCEAQLFFTDVSDLNNIDPLLGELNALRPIYVPQLGSPAIDRVPAADCDVTQDQVGIARPKGAGCDVGAFERVNRAPEMVDDEYEVGYGDLLAVDEAEGVLANDSDADGDTLVAVLATPPAHGIEFELYSNGAFIYQPDPDFHGEDDSFTYVARDGVTGTTQVATVTIHVAPKPLSAPDHLSVVEGGDTQTITDLIPVFPTLRWTHRESNADTSVPGKWYELAMVNSAGTLVLDVWMEAAQYCKGLVCEVPTFQTYTPEALMTLPTYGLVNDTYQFYVRGWAGPGLMTPWSEAGTFTVNVPLPQTPTVRNADPRNGRPSFDWLPDPVALYYQLTVRDSNGATIFSEWYPRPDVCSGGLCETIPDINPLGGAYSASLIAWGPGGMTAGGSPTFVDLPTTPPAVLDAADMTVLYDANPDVPVEINSGEPLFVWPVIDNATWFNIVIWTSNATFTNVWFKGDDICDDTQCIAKPPVYLTNNSYNWAFRSWGPGGFNDGNATAYLIGSFGVSAAAPTVPVLVAPVTPTDTTPIYAWERVTDASWYNITVVDTVNNSTIVNSWLSADDVGCGPGDSALHCLYQPGTELVKGTSYTWRVRSYTPAGTISDWSPAASFTVTMP